MNEKITLSTESSIKVYVFKQIPRASGTATLTEIPSSFKVGA